MRISKKLLTIAVAITLSSTAFAASTTNKGSNPNGKPFVEINGQISEVISSIEAHQAEYEAVLARVDAIEALDFQGQINAINAEITTLNNTAVSLQAQVSDLSVIATTNGQDIEAMMLRLGAIDDEIVALKTTTGDNTLAIADLEAEQLTIKESIALNAAGLLATIDDLENNYATIDLLNARTAELEQEIALKQDDISGSCTTSGGVSAVADDGTLICNYTNSAGVLYRTTANSSYIDLDSYSYQQSYTYYCGGWYSSYCTGYRTVYVNGSKSARATCPAGYTIAGGGHSYYDQNAGTVRVRTSIPSGNGWSVYYQQLGSSTSGHYGYVYANCLKAN